VLEFILQLLVSLEDDAGRLYHPLSMPPHQKQESEHKGEDDKGERSRHRIEKNEGDRQHVQDTGIVHAEEAQPARCSSFVGEAVESPESIAASCERSLHIHSGEHECECGEERQGGAEADNDLMCNQHVIPKWICFFVMLDGAMVNEHGADTEACEQS